MLWAVLLLTRVLGRTVSGPDGEAVGRLADFIVRLSDSSEPQLIDRRVVSRRRAPALLLPWDLVSDVRSGRVVLAANGAELAGFETDSPDDPGRNPGFQRGAAGSTPGGDGRLGPRPRSDGRLPRPGARAPLSTVSPRRSSSSSWSRWA